MIKGALPVQLTRAPEHPDCLSVSQVRGCEERPHGLRIGALGRSSPERGAGVHSVPRLGSYRHGRRLLQRVWISDQQESPTRRVRHCYVWCTSTCVDLTLPLHRYLQPSDVSHAVMSLLNQPRTACISDIQLQPQRDLFRQALFANVPALKTLVKQPGPVPFVDARVALVTGAGKGIGRAVVLGLAQDGFDGVTVIARNKVLHAHDR